MPEQKPTVGRTVLYRLTDEDAERVNRRRTTSTSIAERLREEARAPWPAGAQAHIGNQAKAGEAFPMVVVRVYADDPTYVVCNGQVFLDGNDTLWVTSVPQGEHNGTWAWPERV